MAKLSKAAVMTAAQKIEVFQLPIPEVRDDGMLIKMDFASICGSDTHVYKEAPPHPFIMGHELTGTVVEMGKDANKRVNCFYGPLKVGDRIALYPSVTCGKCYNCLTYGNGSYSMCDNAFAYGDPFIFRGEGEAPYSTHINEFPYLTGGFSEYMYVYPETYVWKLPDDMPSTTAVLLDPLAVAVRSVELAQRAPGIMEDALNWNTTALVIGDGAIGTLTAMVARRLGIRKLIIAGGSEQKLKLAKEIASADETINCMGKEIEEIQEIVYGMTNGCGADVVFNCVGSAMAFREGIACMKRLGTLIETGNAMKPNPTTFDPHADLCAKHATYVGMMVNTPQCFNKSFSILMDKNLGIERILTHRCKLDTLDDMMHHCGDADYMKALVAFD